MGLFDDDYSFDDLLGDLDFSYSVGTDTSGDVSVDDSGPSFLDEIYGDMIGGFDNYDEDPPWTEIFGPSYQFLDNDFDDYSWLDDILQGDEDYSADDIIGMTDEDLAAAIAGGEDAGGPFGWGILPGIRNTLFGQGQGPLGGNVLGGGGILGQILGFGGQGGGGLFGGGGEAGEGGLGSFLSGANPLMQFLAMKSLMKDDGGGGGAPIGGQAYGGPAFNYQDYQPTNLTPALMPGVGYANMGAPGMMHGGSTDDRPGDITFAKLEPGEFVIQKPAVDAIGIETLRKINSMGDGRSYNG